MYICRLVIASDTICIPMCIFLTSLREPVLSWLIQQSSLTSLAASSR